MEQDIFQNYYTIKQVASVLKLTERYVYNLIHTGKLRACKLAGNQKKNYVEKEELERYIREAKIPYIATKTPDTKNNYDTMKESLLNDTEFLQVLSEKLNSINNKQ